jgi:urease accessory protein
MRAAAHVVAETDGAGGTRLVTMRSESPLLMRRTGASEIHLVAGAAGPLGGDQLTLEIEVGMGATLCVRSVAATIARAGPGCSPSRTTVSARVAVGGRLAWLCEPLVAAGGCHHVNVSTMDVAAGGCLVWREELVCGRHDEQPGDARTRTALRLDDVVVYDHQLAVGPQAPGWAGAAVLAGARAVGSMLVVDPRAEPVAPTVLGPTAVIFPLAGTASVTTATGADLREVRAHLDRVVADTWLYDMVAGDSGTCRQERPMV